MKQTVTIFLILSTLLMVLPLPAAAFSLVPCGRADQQPPRDAQGNIAAGVNLQNYPDAECQLGHFFILIVRVINYMISLAAVVAIYQIIFAGWTLTIALGNAEQIEKGKQTLKQAVVGFAIVVLAFVFINLLINGILGDTDKATRRWWEPGCLYDITNSSAGCPKLEFFRPMSQQATVPAGGQVSGNCTGTTCSDSNLNICGPVQPSDGCYENAINTNWHNAIVAGVGSNTQIAPGIRAVPMLKAIMARESSGIANRRSSSVPPSLGLFQLKVQTANDHKTGCITANIDESWLLSGGNAQAQACIAAAYLRSLVSVCGANKRQLAAGYNGGPEACDVSRDCGPSAGAGECSMCANQGSRPTKRWECLWDDNAHQDCNVNRSGNFSETRSYAPRVEYCYGRF